MIIQLDWISNVCLSVWCGRSCDLDEWSQEQLDIMKVSGNGVAATFFKGHGVSDSQMQVPIHLPLSTNLPTNLPTLSTEPPTYILIFYCMKSVRVISCHLYHPSPELHLIYLISSHLSLRRSIRQRQPWSTRGTSPTCSRKSTTRSPPQRHREALPQPR
jgi:hypothetical protein